MAVAILLVCWYHVLILFLEVNSKQYGVVCCHEKFIVWAIAMGSL